jgi:hypothetical protein
MANSISSQSAPPTGLELKLTQALQGAQTVLPTGSSLNINQAAMTQAQIVQQLQNDLAPFSAARSEKTIYLAKLQAKTAVAASAREFLVQFRNALVASFGRNSPQLAEFGFNPAKPRVQTSGQKALSAAKAVLTRKARGTKGSKQKAAITTVGTPVVTIGPSGTQVAAPTFSSSATATASPSMCQTRRKSSAQGSRVGALLGG